MPPGADQLGQGGIFPNLTVQDAIQSSLSTYKKYGYSFDATKHFISNSKNAFRFMAVDPRNQGPRFTGIFSIPVCNVSDAINQTYKMKEYILQDYGHESRPKWCGPVCSNDQNVTDAFLHAAHMDGFKSPTVGC